MIKQNLWLPALLLAGAACIHATTLNTVQLYVSPDFCCGTPYGQTANNNGPLSLSGSGTGGYNSSGDGSVYTDWGVIKMKGEFSGTGDTLARGIFRDMITVTPVGVTPGSIISVDYSIFVAGTLGVTDIGQASWLLQAALGGAFSIDATGDYNPNTNPTNQGGPFGLFTATVQLQAGSAAQLDVELTGTAQSSISYQFPNGGTATFALNHSLYWGGISNVTYNGQPVSGYTVTSASGTDYSGSLVPVSTPEPASGLGIAAAVLALQLFRRYRRQ